MLLLSEYGPNTVQIQSKRAQATNPGTQLTHSNLDPNPKITKLMLFSTNLNPNPVTIKKATITRTREAEIHKDSHKKTTDFSFQH